MIDCSPHVRIKLKAILGSIHKAAGVSRDLKISNTDEVCRDLEWFIKRYPLELSDADSRVLRDGAKRHVKQGEKLARILQGDIEIPDVKMAIPPRPYQEQAAAAVLTTGYLLLVDELGLGKSCSAIRVMADKRALPALAVVDTALAQQWVEEIHKFLPDLRVHVAKSRTPYDVRDEQGREPHVIVITYSRLASWSDHLAERVKFVVFDEAQELRTGAHGDRVSAKNVAAVQIGAHARYRMGLTGTPVYNYGGEMFNILDVLAPGRLGTPEEFKREWCGGYNDRKAPVTDPKAFGSFLRAEGFMLRRTRDDVGRQLPPVSRVMHEIHEDNPLKSEFFDASSAAAELARIVINTSAKNFDRMQAGAQLDALLRQATGISKAPSVAAFVRMLLEQEPKIVLFGWHREVYRIWGELLADLQPAWYTGTESETKKRAEVQRFLSGDARVLIMSLRSARGLNRLQEVCATAVHGELDWSPMVHEQATGRLHRDGQARPVFAYYAVASWGSDPIVSDVLGIKTAQSEGIRDPDGAAVISRTVDPEHVKMLALDYLRRIGEAP